MISPYVYKIHNNVTNEFYYGSRCKNVSEGRTPSEDFWKYYFTSSKKIKSLIEIYGRESFSREIIFTDPDYDICYWKE